MPGTGSQRRARVAYRWPQQDRFSPVTAVAGGVAALAFGLALAIVFALVLRATATDERILDYAADLGSFLSLGLVALVVGRRVRSRGLLYGASIGLAYGLLCTLVALVLPAGPVRAGRVFLRVILLVIVGAAGSVLGVNL